jgi:tRNA (guanine37-N1)-methyltransferase
MLEYPQYTRPEVWRGLKVPKVLLSGDHAGIQNWQEGAALKITKEKRPDLLL